MNNIQSVFPHRAIIHLQKDLNIVHKSYDTLVIFSNSLFVFQRSQEDAKTRGWVNDNKTVILEWSIPLVIIIIQEMTLRERTKWKREQKAGYVRLSQQSLSQRTGFSLPYYCEINTTNNALLSFQVSSFIKQSLILLHMAMNISIFS